VTEEYTWWGKGRGNNYKRAKGKKGEKLQQRRTGRMQSKGSHYVGKKHTDKFKIHRKYLKAGVRKISPWRGLGRDSRITLGVPI